MIITEQKPFAQLIDILKTANKIFLIGCGECATSCKTGGEKEIAELKDKLQASGKEVVGSCIPKAPCVASQLKAELAKNIKDLRKADSILVLACGLGVQSAKENDRLGLAVLPGCNTLFGAVMDSRGNFYEKCSLCGECILDITGGICPVTICSKGLLNGPCGGMDSGKCEVDKNKDCAWVLIYRELEKTGKLANFRKIQKARQHTKSIRPRELLINK
ncbi:MAG: 5,10-methylenetetrahydrofolate reductase [Candidatus Omnitrophota bacterium]|jgi:ferredoxin|nr:MAG: 5,10-methylenetetrahydrofolate reductase [Candidatus Omnitrophota bacterium]